MDQAHNPATPDPQLLREVSRARQAQEVMDNPLFQEAFNSLQEQLRREWESSPARDTEGRERIWLAVNLLGKVRQHLEQTMQTGSMARMQLEQQRSRWQTLKEAARRRWF
jgi:hypothetical protein